LVKSLVCYDILLARDSIMFMRAVLYAIARPFVCLSVCVSHGWISQKL